MGSHTHTVPLSFLSFLPVSSTTTSPGPRLVQVERGAQLAEMTVFRGGRFRSLFSMVRMCSRDRLHVRHPPLARILDSLNPTEEFRREGAKNGTT
ncbi:hypothetical protein V8E53_000568 [Lactarius tabidus]